MPAEISLQPGSALCMCAVLSLGAFPPSDLGIEAAQGDRFSEFLCAGIHLDAQILLETGIPFSHGS